MEPPKKTAFPAEFCDKYYATYLYTKNNHIQAEKNSKWQQNERFSFLVISIFRKKIEKLFSQRKFSMKFDS